MGEKGASEWFVAIQTPLIATALSRTRHLWGMACAHGGARRLGYLPTNPHPSVASMAKIPQHLPLAVFPGYACARPRWPPAERHRCVSRCLCV